MTTYAPDPLLTNVPYASALCPLHPIHSATVFYPPGPGPAAGYAAKVIFQLSAFTDTSLPSSIGDAQKQAQNWLDTGHALIYVQLPVARGGNTGNNVSDASFDPGNGLYGASYPGNGTAQLTGWTRFSNPAYFNPIKGGAMALQWIVAGCDSGRLRVDKTKLSLHGRSAGGVVAAYLYYSPNLAPLMFPAGTGQDAVDTRCAAHLSCDGTATWFPIFDLDGAPAYDPGTGAGVDFKAYAFATIASGTASDVPADTMDQVLRSTRHDLSPLVVGQIVSVDAANKLAPAYFTASGLGTAGAPYDFTNPNVEAGVQAAAEQKVHSIWGGAAMRAYFGSAVRLVRTGVVDPPSGLEDATIDTAVAGGDDLLYADALAHMDTALGYVYPAVIPESVEERALQAIEDELRAVTAANGYRTTIRFVCRSEDYLADELPQYPAVMTTAIEASYDDTKALGYVKGMARLGLALVLKKRDTVTRRMFVSRFIADVRKALQVRFVADQFGGLVTDLQVVSTQRYIADDLTTPICGAILRVELSYADTHADPYVSQYEPN